MSQLRYSTEACYKEFRIVHDDDMAFQHTCKLQHNALLSTLNYWQAFVSIILVCVLLYRSCWKAVASCDGRLKGLLVVEIWSLY